MELLFFMFSCFTVIFTIFSVLQNHVMYALFYFFLSIITTSGVFFLFGFYFIGSLQIIIYAGAILVLFVFVIMLFDNNQLIETIDIQKFFSFYLVYPVSLVLTFIFLMVQVLFCLKKKYIHLSQCDDLKMLGSNLLGSYIIITELSSILLLSSLVIVFIVSQRNRFVR